MQLRTLGGLALEGSNLTRQRPLLLLAFVALQGGATRRELADLFFMHAADPRDSLSAAVGQVRRAAGDMLVLDDNTVTTTVPCDAVMLLNDFDDYRFESVIRAYRGPFCAGYDQTMGEELEEWLFSMREQLALRTRSALLHRSRAAAADGRLDEARRAVSEALALVEAPEQTAEAIAGLVPHLALIGSPELTAIEELARDLDFMPLPARGPPTTLTMPPGISRSTVGSTFVGRAAELEALRELATSPNERIVTVFGLGGIGKSRLVERLADEVSAALAGHFPDGVHRVYLESVAAPQDVEATIATRLGFPPDALVAGAGLAGLIRNWRALIVLDNFEQVRDAAPLLADIVGSCPGVRLVVTSRTRLGLSGERTFALGGLAVAAAAGARGSDAARLFIDRAGRVGLVGELSPAELAEIEALCSDLDGYPLGIELAAGMLRVLPLGRLRDSIRRSLDVLAQGPLDAPERHRAVRAAFEPSWRGLARNERGTVMRLSVFMGGCDLDGANAVAGVDLQVLGGLVDQAFLRHDSRSGRFTFHPLVREFVAAKRPEALFKQASEQHCAYFGEVLAGAAAGYKTSPDGALDQVASDIDNILGAVEWALSSSDADAAITMMKRLVVDCDYLQARGGGSRMTDLIERVAEAAAATGDLASADRLFAKAGDAHRLYAADSQAALVAYRRALGLAHQSGDVFREALLLGLIGAYLVHDDRAAALTHLTQATAMAMASGDELLQCEVLNKAGFIAHALGDFEAYRDANLRVLELAQPLLQSSDATDQYQRIELSVYHALHNLGVAEDDLGHLEESLVYRRKALQFATERGHRLWMGWANEDLTFLLLSLGRTAEARTCAEAARAHYTEMEAETAQLQFDERLATEDAAGAIKGVRDRPG